MCNTRPQLMRSSSAEVRKERARNPCCKNDVAATASAQTNRIHLACRPRTLTRRTTRTVGQSIVRQGLAAASSPAAVAPSSLVSRQALALAFLVPAFPRMKGSKQHHYYFHFGRYMEGKEKQQVAFIPFLPSKLVMVCGFFLSPLLPTAVL